jgi:hypothetical protein
LASSLPRNGGLDNSFSICESQFPVTDKTARSDAYLYMVEIWGLDDVGSIVTSQSGDSIRWYCQMWGIKLFLHVGSLAHCCWHLDRGVSHLQDLSRSSWDQ